MREDHDLELNQLRQQHERLTDELREELANKSAADDAGDDELRQRYEMALEDLRELKAENARLTKDAARARSAPAAAPVTGDGFDWETQKQRLLAQLECDFDDKDPEHAKERMTVEGTIRITDQVVAARDKEIAELRELLEQQAESIGNVAVGASAIAEMLDQDELIREERAEPDAAAGRAARETETGRNRTRDGTSPAGTRTD